MSQGIHPQIDSFGEIRSSNAPYLGEKFRERRSGAA